MFNIRLRLGGLPPVGDLLITPGESAIGGPWINLPTDEP